MLADQTNTSDDTNDTADRDCIEITEAFTSTDITHTAESWDDSPYINCNSYCHFISKSKLQYLILIIIHDSSK